MRIGLSLPLLVGLGLFTGCNNSTSTAPNGTTTSVVSASAATAPYGGAVTLTANVTSPAGTPTGTVNFLVNGNLLGPASLASGSATLSTSALPGGTDTVNFVYLGAGVFTPSISAPLTVTVNPVASTVTLTASPSTVLLGSLATLTATVTQASGSTAPAAPTGTVSFYNGPALLGTGTLTAATGGTSATATLTTSSLPAGNNLLTASFAGSGGFAAGTSSTTPLVVTSTSANFNFTTPNQTITGFGGAEAFYSNYLDSHPNQAAIMNALFSPTTGLGITLLRLQNNYYNYNGSNATTFDTDNALLIKQATTAMGSAPTVLMSAWTPPASLKSNNSLNGCTAQTSNGGCTPAGSGTLAQAPGGGYNYAGYGQFWLSSLKAYAALGVVPQYISIQNEPDFPASYVGCLFNPTEAPAQLYIGSQSYASYGLAFNATYQAIHATGALTSVPQMIGPEAFSVNNVQSLLTQVNASQLAAVGHHLYNVPSAGGNPASQVTPETTLQAQYPTSLKFETEYYQSPGFSNAVDIHNALTVANDNMYLYWGLTWPSTITTQAGIATDDEAGLIYIDNPYTPSSWIFPNVGWAYNDAYYTMKHFSYFIRPGYIRYNASITNPNEQISVYQSPDQSKTVIVILNTSTTSTDSILLNLNGITYNTSSVYRSTFSTPISTQGAERWNSLGSYSSAGITMAPQSVVTVALSK